jgi:hypothetical protein
VRLQTRLIGLLFIHFLVFERCNKDQGESKVAVAFLSSLLFSNDVKPVPHLQI